MAAGRHVVVLISDDEESDGADRASGDANAGGTADAKRTKERRNEEGRAGAGSPAESSPTGPVAPPRRVGLPQPAKRAGAEARDDAGNARTPASGAPPARGKGVTLGRGMARRGGARGGLRRRAAGGDDRKQAGEDGESKAEMKPVPDGEEEQADVEDEAELPATRRASPVLGKRRSPAAEDAGEQHHASPKAKGEDDGEDEDADAEDEKQKIPTFVASFAARADSGGNAGDAPKRKGRLSL
jgi:hypothetical protein